MLSFRRTCREARPTASRIRLTQPRPVLGQPVPEIEHHVPAVVQRILRQTLPWNGNASERHYSLSWTLARFLRAGRGTRRLGGLLRLFLGGALGSTGAAAGDRQQHFALAFDALLLALAIALGFGGRRSGLLLVGEALLERIHQVDDVAARLRRGLRR